MTSKGDETNCWNYWRIFQTLYKESKERTNVASMDQETDDIVDRVDSETRAARLFLAKGVDKGSEGITVQRKGGKSDDASAKG